MNPLKSNIPAGSSAHNEASIRMERKADLKARLCDLRFAISFDTITFHFKRIVRYPDMESVAGSTSTTSRCVDFSSKCLQ